MSSHNSLKTALLRDAPVVDADGRALDAPGADVRPAAPPGDVESGARAPAVAAAVEQGVPTRPRSRSRRRRSSADVGSEVCDKRSDTWWCPSSRSVCCRGARCAPATETLVERVSAIDMLVVGCAYFVNILFGVVLHEWICWCVCAGN